MKLRPFITHTLILAIGIAIGGAVVGYTFIFKELPNAKSYIGQEARYIQLKDGEEPVEYEKILNEYFLGKLYLWNPLYKFKQDEGIKILESLANRGYTPAAWVLHNHYIGGSYDLLAFSQKGEFIMKNKEAYDKAYQWAHLAAEQGFGGPLAQMLHYFKLPEYKDVTEDVKLLEKLAPLSAYPTYAKHLSTYYTEQNNPEEAIHWAKVAEEIESKPFKRPACEVITPWRGR